MATNVAVRTIAPLLTVGLLVVPVCVAAQTVIQVTTTLDDLAINGNCTLREALIAANTDSAVDACRAGSGPDTVVLRSGRYLLSLMGPGEDAARAGDLDITSEMTLRGIRADAVIIDAGSDGDPQEWPADADRVLHVLSSGNLSLVGVTIRGGDCGAACGEHGGGIFNAGQLVIRDSNINGNFTRYLGEGAGIYSLGELTLTRVNINGNVSTPDSESAPGGGLSNQGVARLEHSVITGNYAAAGGGVLNRGTLDIEDSQIANNLGRFWGAGLTNRMGSTRVRRTTISGNADGAVVNGGEYPGEVGTLTIENSTLSGNRSSRIPGSIINFQGDVDVTGSTIADNSSYDPGAGIGYGGVRLRNTIVANPGSGDCVEPVASFGHNLDSDGTCGLSAVGDLPNTDPRLRALSDNLGSTLTHALLPDSPAIDRIAAADCAITTDQRGVARSSPAKGLCDIGAYEFSPAGEIRLIADGVFDLRVQPESLGSPLLQTLESAAWLAEGGYPHNACIELDYFINGLGNLVSHGIVSATAAQPLLEAAARVRGMLCPPALP